MPNTLTDLIPNAYTALNIVSRELVGLIPSVTRDAVATRAAVNQTVRFPVAPAAVATNITPGVTPPDDGDQVIGNRTLVINKQRRVPIRWNGEEQAGLNNGGAGVASILPDQIAEALRTLTNEMEADLAALSGQFSRAAGAAGTTPFGTAGNYTDASNALRILLDNGTANSDLQLVVNTAAGSNLRGIQGGKANEAGSASILRQGVLLDINGFAIRESAAIVNHTKGTASGSTTNNAGYAVGATVITLASAGTGTIVAGDVITFAGQAHQYVVVSGDADVSGGGTITLAAPGLRAAIPASTTAITVLNNSARNMAFRRSSLVLSQRLPYLPQGGDLAMDRQIITDPISGLSFELAMYPQYRQIQYEISCAWGVGIANPAHTALLLG